MRFVLKIVEYTAGDSNLLMMSQSAEPSRKRAYGNDLRWRIVYQRIAMNLPYQKVAENLNVYTSTAHRIFSRFMQLVELILQLACVGII